MGVRAAQCPRRLARPRTPAFHVGNTGSNPVGDATAVNVRYYAFRIEAKVLLAAFAATYCKRVGTRMLGSPELLECVCRCSIHAETGHIQPYSHPALKKQRDLCREFNEFLSHSKRLLAVSGLPRRGLAAYPALIAMARLSVTVGDGRIILSV
jgi:hypothetical protein